MWIYVHITKQKAECDNMNFDLHKLPRRFTMQHADSIFTAMQGDPDVTHNARRKTASSPRPFRLELVSQRMGEGEEMRRSGERGRDMEEDMDDTSKKIHL